MNFDSVRVVKYTRPRADVDIRVVKYVGPLAVVDVWVCPECRPDAEEILLHIPDGDIGNNVRALLTGEMPIGEYPDSHIDGHSKRWSYGCRCGEYWDGYPNRDDARRDYREHKKECRAAGVRGPVIP